MPETPHVMSRRTAMVAALLAGNAMPRLAAAITSGRPLKAGPARATTLEEGFRWPPLAARPRTWWHWMNGNVTEDGIGQDLAWMHRVGIGGVHVFDAALATPVIVDRQLKYMSPEWKKAFRYSAMTLERYGMEMGIAASPGWSETGGPWVAPENAMKKLVWTETVIEGGKHFRGSLPQPPTTPGVYQDIPIPAPPVGEAPPAPPHFYRDVTVFAFPEHDAADSIDDISYSDTEGRALDAAILTDPRYNAGVEVSAGGDEFIRATMTNPASVRSVEFYAHDVFNVFFGSPLRPVLEASTDDIHWVKVTEIVICAAPSTVSFAPVTAKHFRVRFLASPDAVEPLPKHFKVGRFRLSSAARINQFEAKAAYSVLPRYFELDDSVGPDIAGIAPSSIVSLDDHLKSGVLDWTPPGDGRWRVIRLGYSLTGKQNHPAVSEATGLEVDKYDARAVRSYINTYLDMYANATGPDLFGAHGLQALLTDSTEVGASNWTPLLVSQFKRLKGYDPTPWLPALTGVIVGSRARSDGFLYDFRRTLADLMASEHYGTIAEVGRQRGLFVYAESLEAGRPTLGDDLDMRRFADIPMAALWTWERNEASTRPALIADCKGAASVAHLYGQNVAAAESMTSGNALYAQSPSDLKRVVDLEFALGINRIVIHTSPHQPLDSKKPGLTLQVFGQAFTRHNSWAEMAKPWLDYMARSSFLLQQGRNVADVAYFYGEDASPTSLYQLQFVQDAPTRYAFDYVGALPLLSMARVDNELLTFSSGARYRILYLGGTCRMMTLPVLRKLYELAAAGLTIVGPAPKGSPSGADDAAAFATLRRRMWSKGEETRIGRGRTLALTHVEEALFRLGVAPDFSAGDGIPADDYMFVHRKIDDGDLYYVNNRTARPATLAARFRVKGRAPELWRAETGEAFPLSYHFDGDHTVVSLDVAAEDAFFVAFRKLANSPAFTVRRTTDRRVANINGPWTMRFEPGRGAPEGTVDLAKLAPLNESTTPGIRYFSGVATYQTEFAVPQNVPAVGDLWLDLGDVGDVAEVIVNGEPAGIVWKAPYAVNIGRHRRPGANRLEVRVANLWLNRLVGDLQPGATPVAYASNYTMTAQTPLRKSGLIGPVQLRERVVG